MPLPRYALLASALVAAPSNTHATQPPALAAPGPSAAHPALPHIMPQTPCERADLASFTLHGLRTVRTDFILKLQILEARMASDQAMPEDIRRRFLAARINMTNEVKKRDGLIAETENVLQQETAACLEHSKG